jgi:hypothetical protein
MLEENDIPYEVLIMDHDETDILENQEKGSRKDILM